MKKLDPFNHERRWANWKKSVEKGIPEISKANSDIILECLSDLEMGLNVSDNVPKGARAPSRLNDLRVKLIFFAKNFEQLFSLRDMTKISEDQLFAFFKDIQSGKILSQKGKPYRCIDTFAKDFKTFWNWYMKAYGKRGMDITNIIKDLNVHVEKPDWVYLTEKQVKMMCEASKYEHKVLIWFLFDTGIRAPTELMNLKVSDLSEDCKELNIRDLYAKKNSFGRKIKLMLCSDLLKDYIKTKELKRGDYLFSISPPSFNKYLKRLAVKLFGDFETEAGHKTSQITMYDFRHNACCYWLVRYKSESALKYRFGWKKSDKIHYYSELLGMKDTISEEDMLIDVSKTELERKIEIKDREYQLLKEKVDMMENQMEMISKFIKSLKAKKDIAMEEV